jgi:D-tyrosyl-tRNA(Tyr) deacylase
MNRSVLDHGGDILVVSQFTLYGNAAKGNRPSFIESARPELAEPLYESFCEQCADLLGKPIQTGEFGAMMDVELLNWGPVTLDIEKRNS